MAIPVSIRTHHAFLHDLCKPPLIGGFVILLVAFGPPTIVTLLSAAVASLLGAGHLFFKGLLDITPLYIFVACTAALFWNLFISRYWTIRIRILFMPAWAFALLGMVLAPISHFAGWE